MTCHVARRVDEFERRLRTERYQVTRAIDVEDVEMAGLEVHASGDVLDDAARELAYAVLARLEARDHHALAEIRAAEARLADGTYGRCQGCGRPIALARLRALPTARRCVGCEARRRPTDG